MIHHLQIHSVTKRQSERTTSVETTNSLDVRLRHFDPLSHVLYVSVGDDGGQTVRREKPTETDKRRLQIKFTERKSPNMFLCFDSLPAVVHDGGDVVMKTKRLAFVLSEVSLHSWNISVIFTQTNFVVTTETRKHESTSTWKCFFLLVSPLWAFFSELNTWKHLQDVTSHWFRANQGPVWSLNDGFVPSGLK